MHNCYPQTNETIGTGKQIVRSYVFSVQRNI